MEPTNPFDVVETFVLEPGDVRFPSIYTVRDFQGASSWGLSVPASALSDEIKRGGRVSTALEVDTVWLRAGCSPEVHAPEDVRADKTLYDEWLNWLRNKHEEMRVRNVEPDRIFKEERVRITASRYKIDQIARAHYMDPKTLSFTHAVRLTRLELLSS